MSTPTIFHRIFFFLSNIFNKYKKKTQQYLKNIYCRYHNRIYILFQIMTFTQGHPILQSNQSNEGLIIKTAKCILNRRRYKS